MKIKNSIKLLCALLFILNSSLSFAENETDWVVVSTKKDKISIKKGSFDFINIKNGDFAASVIGKIKVEKNSAVLFYQWYVTVNDCGKKMGSLVALNTSGKFLDEYDFIFGGENNSSNIAEIVCGIAEEYITDYMYKSSKSKE